MRLAADVTIALRLACLIGCRMIFSMLYDAKTCPVSYKSYSSYSLFLFTI